MNHLTKETRLSSMIHHAEKANLFLITHQFMLKLHHYTSNAKTYICHIFVDLVI